MQINDNKFYSNNIVAVLMAGMLWGTTGTSQALLPASASPLSVGAVRLAFGGILLMTLVLLKDGFKGIKGPWPLKATLIAVLGVAGFQASFFCAVMKTGVVAGTMMAAGTAPIFAGILGYLVEKEKLTMKWVASTFLCIIGVVFLALSKQELAADTIGILLALLASFLYSVYGLGIKKMNQGKSSTGTMAVIFGLGTILILPAFLLFDFSWLATPKGFGIGLYLGLGATAVAYSLFAKGISRIPVSSAYTLSLSEPLTACLLGVLLLGETLTPVGLAGIILMFTGLIILSLPVNLFKPGSKQKITVSTGNMEDAVYYRSIYPHNSKTIGNLSKDYQRLA